MPGTGSACGCARGGSRGGSAAHPVKRLLGKALRGCKEWELPEVVNTDKAPTYAAAIAELKAEGKCPQETRHRQVKYLNNVVEADHGKLKHGSTKIRGVKRRDRPPSERRIGRSR